ncbi:AGC protein kinase [Paracoccidioides lutzii Pb01]|uniref:non-specific serine/threonine protein kinase n=1 Tax=Paracoccidioides lutzii (strain ATCC MYA-826 / Pb01) TaxID=502779 RepID=A0A0A2V2B8_PARBA|nr:AGC protein kinase [Paracoccidioides lutzii Pb01]KGQ01951.1 AGC protein kinase [Paracoccidioides lutzii Pb01]
MADNGAENTPVTPTPPRFLSPPAITALKQEAREASAACGSSGGSSPCPHPMERTISQDIREERQDLKEAAEQTLNVIIDLNLDGRIKWVSPSWKEVVGTNVEDVEGRLISELVLDNKTAFDRAIESMKIDDSKSHIVRFAVKTGPASFLRREVGEEEPVEVKQVAVKEKLEEGKVGEGFEREEQEEVALEAEVKADVERVDTIQVQDRLVQHEKDERAAGQTREDKDHILNLEGQGIMVFGRSPSTESHTMWMLRPSTQPREITIDLPPVLVESLGVGAEVLANYLTALAESGSRDPNHVPLPPPVLCRICERQIPPWWFEKHSELCLQEHGAEMDVQMAQDNLNEHRHAIVKILDALEARKTRSSSGDSNLFAGPQAEYKNLPIGPSQLSSGLTSGTSSSSGTPPRSRDPSTSGLGHTRTRSSFAVRRPLARIVELILDLCDTALEINTPALKEARTEVGEEIRTQSPQSESRISQVLQWQSPSSNTLEQEQGLAALSADTERFARAKVDAVFRHRQIVEYSERIRVEFTVLVQECISAAMSKAERIAAGELSDSSGSSSSINGDSQEELRDLSVSHTPDPLSITSSQPLLLPSSSGITAALRVSSEPSLVSASPDRPQPSSVAVSTRSSSPVECPTPRSHKSVGGLLNHPQTSKRGSLLAESDAGDSDCSVLSSVVAGTRRTESPSSERGVSRAASSKDRKRQSLILPGMSVSPRRESPARNQPHSPLRLSKPRLSMGESFPSPMTSPLLSNSDLGSHQYYPPPSSHHHHHRRLSSATSPDLNKTPVSPHLSSVSHPPPPRAVAPSIKDFEIIKPISKGAFGSVYLSKKKSTGEYFAIKVLKKADMVVKNQVTNVKAERAIMMWQGESDFVAKLYWTFSSKDYLYLVMEYLNGGDCASLVKVLGGLSEDWAKKYIAEVVLGIEHLHERGIVHRDLKPDNLLIDQKGHLKLTDFGLSRMGLVGRQKRILKNPNESAPDLLKTGPFTRATSLASSRSASFDFPATASPNSTPSMTPEVPMFVNQPSYFSLNKEPSFNRETSRRTSGYRSDSGGSDTLAGMFRGFSLYESGETSYPMSLQQQQPQFLVPQPGRSIEEETQSEGSDSPYLYPLQTSTSCPTSSVTGQHGTPPQQSIIPPPMALFDPEDHNRRFVGTPDYLAPETINGVGQDEMSDWWSLGCILFEFLYGYPPFNASTPDEVFENILNRRINWPDEADELVTPEAKDLMNGLMTINPAQRLGSNASEKYPNGGAEVRAHPWFADINWDTLLEDEAQFVPAVENPEDTEYFDARGATLQSFTEELEDQLSPPPATGADYPDRPHDALYKVRTQVNSLKRGLVPLHIPPHVRDPRSRRLSEPVPADDFGNFNFKNLPILERANKDVIQKLRMEAMQAQQRQVPNNTPASSSGPSLEGSPLLPMPLQRTLSQNKVANRPASPSSLSQANSSSPSRPSQPSSPLMVQFSTGQNHERRKTSGSSSTYSHQSSGSLQPGSFPEPPRLVTNFKMSMSAASSPVKYVKPPTPSPEKSNQPRQSSASTSRSRSQTVGSQDSEAPLPKEPFVPGHHKRRSQLFDISPSSSDNEDPRTKAKALLKVQRRRQSSRRLSQINLVEGPYFRPLDVLICEDHPVSKLVMERLFEKLRCRTITAVNGSEAMRYALSEVQFDIIMMEFRLPQLNGADVARMIRDTKSVNTHTPIICCTGYLKDLPETHHFDALIEKPPTLSKLTEALCKFCQWKPPPKDHPLSSHNPILSTGVTRQPSSSMQTEDSPSSTSSGFLAMPTGSYRGSSREDSISSSYFGDAEFVRPDELPVGISRQAADGWGNSQGSAGGLGISDEPVIPRTEPIIMSSPPPIPTTLYATSAPSTTMTGAAGMSVRTPRNYPFVEEVHAKRDSQERRRRYEGDESGDDEDEELGFNSQNRMRSPQCARGKSKRSGSKLGTEMMRTNSRGSVVSDAGEALGADRVGEDADVITINSSEGGTGKLPTTIRTPSSLVGVLGSSIDIMEEGLGSLRIAEERLETLPEDRDQEVSCVSADPFVTTSPARAIFQSPEPIRSSDVEAGRAYIKAEKSSSVQRYQAAEPNSQPQQSDPGTTAHGFAVTDTTPPLASMFPHTISSSTTMATTPPNTTIKQQQHPDANLTTHPHDKDTTPRPQTAVAASGFNPSKVRSTPSPDTYGAGSGAVSGTSDHHEAEGESEVTPRASERDRSREKSRERRLLGLDWIRRT